MASPKQYYVKLIGETPLLMHRDNLEFSEAVMRWRKDPQNKELSVAGDDRSPAWTWIGYLYGDRREEPNVRIDSDCIMSMLRDAGAKLPVERSGRETYKKQTQYGLVVDQLSFKFTNNGVEISLEEVNQLIGNTNFQDHMQFALDHGFELFAKRAVVGRAKHVRVRPEFRSWVAEGSITVFDEQESGLYQHILQRIFDIGGGRIGMCDWRPGSPTPGAYGKFKAEVTLM